MRTIAYYETDKLAEAVTLKTVSIMRMLKESVPSVLVVRGDELAKNGSLAIWSNMDNYVCKGSFPLWTFSTPHDVQVTPGDEDDAVLQICVQLGACAEHVTSVLQGIIPWAVRYKEYSSMHEALEDRIQARKLDQSRFRKQ